MLHKCGYYMYVEKLMHMHIHVCIPTQMVRLPPVPHAPIQVHPGASC